MDIRIATLQDAPALLAIYAPYVEKTAVTFEYTVPSLSEFTERMQNILKQYPYLVAVENDTIVGYCYASQFKTRAAYAWSVETSIYVHENMRHKGIGHALYLKLEECLLSQNVCNLCACIAYPNPSSIAFHEAFGYSTVAHFHKSGYKQEQWYDMVWMEKVLTPHDIPPLPFIPYPQLADRHRKESE